MKKQIFSGGILLLVFLIQANLCLAYSALFSWDANQETDLGGYNVYFGASSGQYGAPIDVGLATSYQTSDLEGGTTYFVVVTAYDTSGNESDFSDEASVYIPSEHDLNETYFTSLTVFVENVEGITERDAEASEDDGIDFDSDAATIDVTESNSRAFFFGKIINTPLVAGQQVAYSFDGKYVGTEAFGRVTTVLVDGDTNEIISEERVVFLTGNYTGHENVIFPRRDCQNTQIITFCGFDPGLYKFACNTVEVLSTLTTAPKNIFLNRLERDLTGAGIHTAVFAIKNFDDFDPTLDRIVRIAARRSDIESKTNVQTFSISGEDTEIPVIITPTFYDGVYVSVCTIDDEEIESEPVVYSYLPGSTYDNKEDGFLSFEINVGLNEVWLAYYGYYYLYRTNPVTDGPADFMERADIDNNTYVGRTSDYSFIRYTQYGKYLK